MATTTTATAATSPMAVDTWYSKVVIRTLYVFRNWCKYCICEVISMKYYYMIDIIGTLGISNSFTFSNVDFTKVNQTQIT